MTWISLAASRYKLREILEHNLHNAQREKSRFEVIDSQLGRYALLVGDEFYIEREIELAKYLLSNYIKQRAPTFHILGDVMDLIVIAYLGGLDDTPIFKSIAGSRAYKQALEKTIRLVARRIAGLEKIPDKRRVKKGNVASEKEWLRLVEDYNPEQVFSLAVTLDHPRKFVLSKFILPTAFLLSKDLAEDERRHYLRRILSWGAANPAEKKHIIYERTGAAPDVETLLNESSESYGFDAVELHDDETIAYYYFGENSEISRAFENENLAGQFFENTQNDWQKVENSIDSEIWNRVSSRREKNKSRYVIVYDIENVDFPEEIVEKASKQAGLDVVLKDITEV